MKSVCFYVGVYDLTYGKVYPIVVISAIQQINRHPKYIFMNDNGKVIYLEDTEFNLHFTDIINWREKRLNQLEI